MSERQAKAERRADRALQAADSEDTLAVNAVLRLADGMCAALSHVLGSQQVHPAGLYRQAAGKAAVLDAQGQPIAQTVELVAIKMDPAMANNLVQAMLNLRRLRACDDDHNVLGEPFAPPVVVVPGGHA